MLARKKQKPSRYHGKQKGLTGKKDILEAETSKKEFYDNKR